MVGVTEALQVHVASLVKNSFDNDSDKTSSVSVAFSTSSAAASSRDSRRAAILEEA